MKEATKKAIEKLQKAMLLLRGASCWQPKDYTQILRDYKLEDYLPDRPLKQKYEVVWLDSCGVSFRDEKGKLQDCGKPAIAIMVFDDGKECTYVCEAHLKEIEKGILESEKQ